LAEVERVIDDGREEIDRLDERAVAAQPVDTGVVEGARADDDVAVVASRARGKPAQDLRQERLAQFGGSTGAAGELRQANREIVALHVPPFWSGSVAAPGWGYTHE